VLPPVVGIVDEVLPPVVGIVDEVVPPIVGIVPPVVGIVDEVDEVVPPAVGTVDEVLPPLPGMLPVVVVPPLPAPGDDLMPWSSPATSAAIAERLTEAAAGAVIAPSSPVPSHQPAPTPTNTPWPALPSLSAITNALSSSASQLLLHMFAVFGFLAALALGAGHFFRIRAAAWRPRPLVFLLELPG
jgi:hypothetical protein